MDVTMTHAAAAGRRVSRMTFKVNPLVQSIADERRERFGVPSSESEATFDLRFCAAAAWVKGRFTTAETAPASFTDPEILALRERIDLVVDADRATFEGCSLVATFTDGTSEAHNIDHFLGTPGARVPDAMLSDLFRQYAEGVLPARRALAILDAAWSLDTAPTLDPLISLLKTA